MEPELELRGHSWIIDRLVTVRSDDGQVLLVSADTHNSVRVWDPLTGELVDGPVKGDEVRTKLAALGLGPVELARAAGRGVVPATERTRALIVDIGGERVQVIDPDSNVVVFEFAQPSDPPGQVGPRVFRQAGVRLGDGTAGFVTDRFSSEVELWAPTRPQWVPGRWRWRRHGLTRGCFGGGLAVLDTGSGGSRLAVSHRRAIAVWDVPTRRRVAWIDIDALIDTIAPVPLADGPLLAVGVDCGRDAAVRICDPYGGQLVGEMFNRHGPAFGQQGYRSTIMALTAVPGPGDTVRVASGSHDGVVRISPPIGKAGDLAFTN
jgi:WD40 repeat protein